MTRRYLYPGNFCRHIGTILGFPAKSSIAAKYHETACQEIGRLAAAISRFEPVRLYAHPEDTTKAHAAVARAIDEHSGSLSNVTVIPMATNHLWVRDTGPIYVRELPHVSQARQKPPTRFAINFGHTEWGFMKQEKDAAFTLTDDDWPQLSEKEIQENVEFGEKVIAGDTCPSPVTKLDSKICLEGGGIVVDGEGTLLATESSILNDNRNPGVSRQDVDAEFHRLLGVDKVIWMPGKPGLDATDVHIDAEVNFIRPGVVVLSRPYAGAPRAWWKVFDENKAILEQSTDAKGRRFELHVSNEPEPGCLGSWAYDDPATNYVNFHFVNGGLILPQFGDKEKDREAVELFRQLCPDRIIRPLHVRALPFIGGVIHCATQQIIDVDAA